MKYAIYNNSPMPGCQAWVGTGNTAYAVSFRYTAMSRREALRLIARYAHRGGAHISPDYRVECLCHREEDYHAG